MPSAHRRAARIDAGLCPYCGREQDRGDGLRCGECTDAETIRRERKRRKRICMVCSAPAARGRRYCARHLRYYRDRHRQGPR